MADSKIVLVTGATGRQGGATARELSSRGWTVHALVRDPDKPAAQALRRHGVTLVRGDLEDSAGLDAALRGVYGVYSTQTFTGPDGLAGEVRQGKAIAEAAARAGVAHFVYGSVGGSERSSGVAHFETKAEIEKHLAALGLPATVLRPTFFISNFEHMGPQWADGELVLTLALEPRTKLQMIAPEDIGVFAADAFDAPADHIGHGIEIAGDELTGARMAEIFARAAGLPVRFRSQPIAQVRELSDELAMMFDWFNTVGFRADLAGLRARHPNLVTLETWVSEHWTVPGNDA